MAKMGVMVNGSAVFLDSNSTKSDFASGMASFFWYYLQGALNIVMNIV